MKIRLHKDAAVRCWQNIPGMRRAQWVPTREQRSYYETLKAIEGMTLDVETEFLFKDQYNVTVEINNERIGVRVMQVAVAEVIDDERPGKACCNWCGKTSTNVHTCEHCHSHGYLTVF